MTPQKRHEMILEKLRLDGQVRVRQLAIDFNVTEDCIRKDLAVLAADNRLQRIHGGAIPTRENPHALKVDDRLNLQEEEKREIASKALELIKPGMMVFLDISTINIEVAKLIFEQKLNVKVVTNMTGVMQVFAAPSPAELIFLGGTFNHSMDGFDGSMTIEQIRNFIFDIAFIGAVGINLEQGAISTYDPFDGLTKEAILDSSSASYLVAEKQKLHQQGNYIYASPDEFSGWICDGGLSPQEVQQAQKKGLRIY